ncbi:hypothetical protein [Acinetobacter johnsonii]|uniref:hypothetical protein n=1 Tax=Acinetobacter johnsonii TaxID=40214 RepID=UPI00244A04E6|nr:hypothetical protein [Acinetobacter johnsonii]MDH1800481.1 hypothetical protein [Acinetobacter johnsonii]
MRKRQIKKNNRTAMNLLMQLDPRFYTEDSFSIEDGIWCAWWRCGGLEPEWDCDPALEQLQMYLENHLSKCDFVETDDEECPVRLVYEFTPNLSTAKKVFNLAKQLIEQSAGGAA